MKKLTLLTLAAGALILPGCTTNVNTDRPASTTSSTTTESTSVRTPVGGASTSTTVRSY